MTHRNRVAIVTGASRGLGAVVSRVLAGRGFDLVLGAREPRPLLELADALAYAGGRTRVVAGDVTDDLVRVQLVEAAEGLGGLHVLVNNASELGGIAPLTLVDVNRLERVLRTNLVAPLALIRSAAPLLAAVGGLVVNVSSDAAQGAYPGWGAYGASKAALELATRTLAAERAGEVSFVSVDPGDIRTRMHQEAFAGVDISDRPLPEVTAPFWHWLFDQRYHVINGQRFAAQQEAAPWLQPA